MMTPAKFKLWREHQVLLAVVNGSWNQQTAEKFSLEFMKTATPLLQAPWAHIVYLDQWELGVPEIEPVIQQLIDWSVRHNLRFAAQVYCPHMVKKYQLERMTTLKSPLFEKRTYPTQQAAFDWLAEEGFRVEQQTFKKLA